MTTRSAAAAAAAANASPLRLDVHVDLTLDGLAGGNLEFAPSVTHYGTFGTHRDLTAIVLDPDATRHTLTLAGYALPPLDEMRGDESINVSVRAKSTLSGMPDLDTSFGDHVQYDIPSGSFLLPVHALLAAHAEQRPLRVPVYDPTLQRHLLLAESGSGDPQASDDARVQDSIERALKGVATVTVTPSGPTPGAAGAYLTAMREKRDDFERTGAGPPLFGTARFAALQQAAMNLHLRAYSDVAFQREDGGPPAFPVGRETSLTDLHMAIYATPFGSLPPANFFQARPAFTPRTPASDRHYGLTREGALLAEAQLAMQCALRGMSTAAFPRVIDAQHAHTGADVSADYLTAADIVAKFGNNVAIASNYKGDYRIGNAAYLEAPDAAAAAPGTAAALKAKFGATLRRRWDAQHRALAAFATGGGGNGGGEEKPNAALTMLESWDRVGVTGEGNAADCEDQGFMSIAPLEDVPTLAALGGRATPLLAAADRFLSYYTAFGVGASVSATPYVPPDDGSSKSKKKEKAAAHPKPVPGVTTPFKFSAEDAAAEIGGHSYAHLVTNALTAAMLARDDGVDVAAELPALLNGRRPAPWETLMPKVLLEGTGPISSYMLPSAEVHPQLARVNAAFRATKAAIHDAAPTLAQATKAMGLPVYDELVDPRVRESQFYRGIVHLLSPKLKAMNPRFGQLFIVDPETRTRGVDTGTFLRDTGSLALVSAYRGLARADVEQQIAPVEACIMNQMPANILHRFRSPPAAVPAAAAVAVPAVAVAAMRSRAGYACRPTFGEAMSRVGHLLSAHSLLAFERYRENPALIGPALDAHSVGMQRRNLSVMHFAAGTDTGAGTGTPDADGKRLLDYAAAHRDSCAVLPLYSQPWRLANADMGKLTAELDQLRRKGTILGHVVWRDRPQPQMDDIIQFALVVPLK